MTTATPRKVRSDARLEQLTPEQHAQLRLWLDDENLSYSEVTRRLSQQFGLSVGRTAVACYYRRHVQSQRYDDDSEAAATISRLSAGHFDAATVNYAKYLAYSALVHPQPEIDKTAKLLNLVRRAEQRDIARDRLELARQRVALREYEVGLRPRRRPRTAADSLEAPETELLSAQPPLPETPTPEAHPAPALSVEASPAESTDWPMPSPSPVPRADAAPATPPPAAALPAASLSHSAQPESSAPHADADPETPPAETPYTDAPLKNLTQNPPTYSPYFALNRAPRGAKITPVLVEIGDENSEFTTAQPELTATACLQAA